MAHPPLIAVVDDDDSVRESLRGLFRSVGLAAQGFASAAAFLQCGDLSGTDCVILDVRMPGMSGIELLAKGRRMRPEMRRLLVRGFADFESALDAINEVGVDRMLVKP